MPKKITLTHGFRPAATVRVTGEDAFEFLQGQFTNDLRGPVESVTYGLWLNQKGKVLADSEILRIADRDFLLTSVFCPAENISQRLEQYIIADDVVLENQTATFSALLVWGESTALFLKELFGETPAAGRFLKRRGVFVFSPRQGAMAGIQIIGPSPAVEELQMVLLARGSVEATNDDVECARIEAGIPSIPHDIGPTDLPQEAGLDATAISFTKGCYLGQEVMARLKNLGQVRRQLQRVRGRGAAPTHGTPLFQGSKKVGEIRSAVATSEGFVAFAMLTRMGLDENAGLAFDIASDTPSSVSLWTK